MAASTAPAPIARSLDEHPSVVRAARKRNDFVTKLATSRAEHDRLLAERERVQREKHLAGVAALSIGQEPPEPEKFTERLTELDAWIPQMAERIAQLEEALAQHDVITGPIRQAASDEISQQVTAAAQHVLRKMAAHLDAFEALSAELEDLRVSAAGTLLPQMHRPICTLIPAWRHEGTHFGAFDGRTE